MAKLPWSLGMTVCSARFTANSTACVVKRQDAKKRRISRRTKTMFRNSSESMTEDSCHVQVVGNASAAVLSLAVKTQSGMERLVEP